MLEKKKVVEQNFNDILVGYTYDSYIKAIFDAIWK